MNTQPVTNSKQPLTPEQRRTLGRVYQFLIEVGQNRLRRLEEQASPQIDHPDESSQSVVVPVNTIQ